jgi:hypothetical protein
MIVRRFFALAALAVVASLSLSGVAHAGYDFSTSVPAANVTGASGSVTVSPATSFTDPNLNGGNPISTPFGYTKFADTGGAGGSAGSTIYLINSYTQNFPVSTAPSTPTTNILISTPSGLSDSSSWAFTSVITITNPSLSGITGTFSERVGYGMQVTSGAGSAVSNLGPLFVGATGITVSGIQFFISNPQATSVQVNFTGGNAALSAQINSIPEPASVVMLGAGLVGVVTLGLRRRLKMA